MEHHPNRRRDIDPTSPSTAVTIVLLLAFGLLNFTAAIVGAVIVLLQPNSP